MIARILIILLPLIVLPDIYIYVCRLGNNTRHRRAKRMLLVAQSIVMVVYTVCLACSKDFVPASIAWLNVYLLLLGVLIIPKVLFTLASLIGLAVRRLCHGRVNYGNGAGCLLALATIYITVYGTTIGFNKLEVKHLELSFPDLPEAFDGYRIVQFSDVHIGTYAGSRQAILSRAVDTVNAQRADMIVFTGDLQNTKPTEIYEHRAILSRLKAPDGVISILGNHDYAQYVKADAATRKAYERETQQLERTLGWQLLMNQHHAVRHGQDSIVIAGMENDGLPPFPEVGDISKTMQGVGAEAFTVMLQHDPTSWRRHILPQTTAQLTLSGHTHNAQFSVFGWSPSQLTYSESYGLYDEGGRLLYVSAGLGGFVPFRFGATGEIVVITLHKTHKP